MIIRSAIAVLACLGAGVGPDKMQAAEAAPAIDASRFSAQLDRIWYTRNVFFADGDLTRATSTARGEAMLTLAHPGVYVVSLDHLHCETALTDAGEELAPASDEESQQLVRSVAAPYKGFRQRSPQRQTIPLSLFLRYPSRLAKVITKLTGSVEALCEAGPGETIDIAPAADWVGKPHEIPGFTGGFTLLSLSPVRFSSDPQLPSDHRLLSLSLIDETGKDIVYHGQSSTGEITTLSGVELPAQGTVRLILLGKTTTVRVPIAFSGIPLDAPLRVDPPTPMPAEARAPTKTGSDF